ncbi:MAG: ABC transporter permease subunit [Acidimicrobiales bacterium]|jgi:ABC-type transport system involved in multi-copper enzyme maturation permease subunit
MTTTVAPYRSELPVGRDGFAQLVRAEFTKFRTVRAWVVTLGVAGALIVVLAWVTSPHTGVCVVGPKSPPICSTPSVPSVPVGPGGEAVVDTFSFLRQPMIGNGSLTVEVSSLTGAIASGNGVNLGPGGQVPNPTHPDLVPWAKAGLIITQSTIQGSRYAAVMVTADHGVRMQYEYTDDVAGLPGTVTRSSPRWLRLTRVGDVITSYDSLDGTHWTEIGAANLAGLPRTVQIGLFVTSPEADLGGYNGSASLATATFGRVHLVGDPPNSSWNSQLVGANTQSYLTLPGGRNWFKRSGGTFAVTGSGDIAPQVSGGALLGMGETTSLLASGTFGLIPVIVLATLFITSEYRRRLIRTTLIASPRRGRVLAAKAAVIGSVTFVAASLATAIAEAISRHVLPANGNYVFPLSTLAEIRVILGTGLLFAVAAIGILGFATVLRRSAGAVVAGIVLFVLPFIVSHPLSSGSDWLMRIMPVAAFAIQGTLPRFAQVSDAYTMNNGYYPLGPWVGLVVLCAWSAVAFGAAIWSIRRRDV